MQLAHPVSLLALAKIGGVLLPELVHPLKRQRLFDPGHQIVAVKKRGGAHLARVVGVDAGELQGLEPLFFSQIDPEASGVGSDRTGGRKNLLPGVFTLR